MSGHANSLSDRDALLARVSSLTPELFSLVLKHFVGRPNLLASEDNFLALICLRYEPEIGPSDLPRVFEAEYKRLLRQTWLRSQKTFFDLTTFIMTHLACLMHRGAFDIVPALQACVKQPPRLPRHVQPCPKLNLTGLENIELDLPTDVFFAMFKVGVPPFPTPDHMYFDEYFLGAGTYLAHTRKLTLTFTASSPWYGLETGPWAEEDGETMRPLDRANVCISGLVVDWILTYAWHHNYLQHIQSVQLQGDIQEWVKEKWYQVFAGTHPEKNDIANRRRIHEIEHHGEQETVEVGERWNPTEHYPPTCRCKVNCSRLWLEVANSEIPPRTEEFSTTEWDDYAEDTFSSAETQPCLHGTDW